MEFALRTVSVFWLTLFLGQQSALAESFYRPGGRTLSPRYVTGNSPAGRRVSSAKFNNDVSDLVGMHVAAGNSASGGGRMFNYDPEDEVNGPGGDGGDVLAEEPLYVYASDGADVSLRNAELTNCLSQMETNRTVRGDHFRVQKKRNGLAVELIPDSGEVYKYFAFQRAPLDSFAKNDGVRVKAVNLAAQGTELSSAQWHAILKSACN